jgi:hypothetical protein
MEKIQKRNNQLQTERNRTEQEDRRATSKEK